MMKNIVIMDNLGRVCIPKDVRNKLHINMDGTQDFEAIADEKNKSIILKQYNPKVSNELLSIAERLDEDNPSGRYYNVIREMRQLATKISIIEDIK